MTFRSTTAFEPDELRQWGTAAAVDLYLDRCQVETPPSLVAKVWGLVEKRRKSLGTVLDFGAGDGRFAWGGNYRRYVGYEVDPVRWRGAELPSKAELVHRCAFRGRLRGASLVVGNPPYVRNQDLPEGWRERAATVVHERTSVELSGLANAWQYFFFLALSATSARGLVALVVPFEWVSRPSSRALRAYIEDNNWNVDVYRLPEEVFGEHVLTTASITIIDKARRNGEWNFFRDDGEEMRSLRFAAGDRSKVLSYRKRSSEARARAVRGLSPGTQEVFILSEARRAELGLRISRDVVPCVTSLRALPYTCATLDEAIFQKYFRDARRPCWLIRPSRKMSFELTAYLKSVPASARKTATCLARDNWWEFTMPDVPGALVATGFRKTRPKVVSNLMGARAVGSVCGIHNVTTSHALRIVRALRKAEIGSKLVAHSNGLKKLEINQLNELLNRLRIT